MWVLDYKKQYYRPHEVAGVFGVHRNTIYNWVEAGVLKSERSLNGQLIFSLKQLLEAGASPNFAI